MATNCVAPLGLASKVGSGITIEDWTFQIRAVGKMRNVWKLFAERIPVGDLITAAVSFDDAVPA